MPKDDFEQDRPARWLRGLLYWHEGKDVHPILGALLTVCAGLGALVLIATALWLIGLFVAASFTYTAEGDGEATRLRNIIFILAAVIGAPFVVWRSLVAHWQARTAEQGLITSRITQAVQQLEAEKTVKVRRRYLDYADPETGEEAGWNLVEHWGEVAELPEGAKQVKRGQWTVEEETQPNLEVRLGAIYALERIAQDSARDHIPIMETLCAYIRENAPARSTVPNPLPDWESLPDDADDEARKAHDAARKERFADFYLQSKAHRWAQASPQPRADIQAALTVLGRRGDAAIRREAAADRPYRLDLRATNLQRADLSGLALGPALLTGARLEGADLGAARLEGALLLNTCLKSTDLRAESIAGSALRSVDLTEVSQIGPELLMTAFGDGSVTLPDGVARPAHWPDAELDDRAFFGHWRGWRESEGLPWPPPGRALASLSRFEAIPPD